MPRAGWVVVALLLRSSTSRAASPAPQPAPAPAPAPTPTPTPTPEPALAPPSTPSMPTPLDGFGVDVVDAFTGTNLLWYGGAIAQTGVLAFGGADHAIRVGVQRSLVAPAFADSAFYAGYILPATVAPVIYLIGLAAHDPVATGAGSAVLQALGMTLVATGLLKVATGRPYPLHGGDPNAPDRLDHPEYAREFRPFQTFWPLAAWPSGHTSTTISVAAALTAYYPDHVWVPLVGYPLALLVGFGMVDGDRHWVSDVVAGGLLGQAIGHSVGSAFRRRVRGDGARETGGLRIAPILSPTGFGMAASGAW